MYKAKLLTVAVCLSLLIGCNGYNPARPNNPPSKQLEIDTTIARFKEKSPAIQAYLDDAYGYVVFPSVGKGGLILGGARDNDGRVYEQGRLIGRARLTEFNIGLQAGGQSFSEIIFFQDEIALQSFTGSNYEFDAGFSSVVLSRGASADADYDRGVAVFTLTNGGLMFEASVGGQKFKFFPEYN